MIKSLRNIIAGAALSLAAALPAKAQSTLISETSARSNGSLTVPLQRLRAVVPGEHLNLRVTQDFNQGATDLLSVDLSSQIGQYTVDFTAYRSGDATGPASILSEAWMVRRFGNNSRVMIDVGTTLSATPGFTGYDWTVIKSKLGLVGLEGAIVYSLKDGERTRMTFGDVSIGSSNAFAALGYQNGTLVGFTGIKPTQSTGNISLGMYNPENGVWSFKSQVGIGDINTQKFSESNYRFTSSYFSIPQFHTTRLAPFSANGNISALVQANGDSSSAHFTGMVGARVSQHLQAGVGASYDRTSAGKHVGLPVHLNVMLPMGPLRATLEATTDVTTRKTEAYLTMSYALGGQR